MTSPPPKYGKHQTFNNNNYWTLPILSEGCGSSKTLEILQHITDLRTRELKLRRIFQQKKNWLNLALSLRQGSLKCSFPNLSDYYVTAPIFQRLLEFLLDGSQSRRHNGPLSSWDTMSYLMKEIGAHRTFTTYYKGVYIFFCEFGPIQVSIWHKSAKMVANLKYMS